MKYPGLLCSWAALVMLAGCGAPVASEACGRLGGLCSDRDEVIGLGLANARNATADLDGDGVVDLVTAAPGGSLSIAWGKSIQREYRVVPGGVADVEVADVDGDGDMEVVFATIAPATLRVLMNTGGRALPEGASVALDEAAQSLWVGALDGDDAPDAVVASREGLTVVTQGLTRVRHIAVGHELAEVQAGDVNGDGLGDIVVVDHGDGAFFVVLAQGAGFAAPADRHRTRSAIPRIVRPRRRRLARRVDPRDHEARDMVAHRGRGRRVRGGARAARAGHAERGVRRAPRRAGWTVDLHCEPAAPDGPPPR